jgi:negative regulator of sigma E activity
MNEEERASQVSALFDGELEASQSELVLRRIMKDPGLRAAWGRYAVIGASLRHEPLSVAALGRDDVAARVASALQAEPELSGQVAPAASNRRGWTASAYKALWGTALAASVAAASIVVLRMQALPEAGAPALMASAEPASSQPVERSADGAPQVRTASATVAGTTGQQVAEATAPSYTTPAVNARNSGLPAPLVNYVVAHTEYLTPVMRFNPLSAVMMGSFEPGGELVEATEAEIGATRR